MRAGGDKNPGGTEEQFCQLFCSRVRPHFKDRKWVYLGIEAQDLKISLFTVAESKPPTNFFVISTVCLFFFFLVFFSSLSTNFVPFPFQWSTSHATSSSMRDKRKRRLRKKLANQNRTPEFIFLNINYHNIVILIHHLTSFYAFLGSSIAFLLSSKLRYQEQDGACSVSIHLFLGKQIRRNWYGWVSLF